MKRLVWTSAAIVGAAVLVGCQKGNKQEVAQVPPPPAYDTSTYEPVTVESVPPPPPAQPQPVSVPSGGTYTVQRGDTLWSIALRVYGDGQRWKDIVAANPGMVPEKLRVGQTINLP